MIISTKTALLLFLTSVIVLAPSVTIAQSEVDVKTETTAEIGVNAGSDESNSSASTKSDVNTEVKGETKGESETKSSESQESSEKSSASEESKGQTTVGNIGVTSMGSSKSTIGITSKYPMPSVSANNKVSLQTDQHLYKPGDRVSVEGSLWTELLASLSDTNVVTITVMDNNKSVIYKADSQITANGDYSTEFSLPDNASKGSYTITSTIMLDAAISDIAGIKGKNTLGATTNIVVVPPQVFKINVENHGDFDVKVASNSTVTDVQFHGDQKKVSVTVEGQSGTRGVSHISVPNSMISGDIKVMIDGKAIADDKVISIANTDAETEIEVNYSHSTHTIDVIGTQAVPEFGTIAMMILVVSIVSIIAVTRSKISLKI